MVERRIVKAAIRFLRKLRIHADLHGQDLIEYSLIAGFMALAAAALLPSVAPTIAQILSTVVSKVGSVTAAASRN